MEVLEGKNVLITGGLGMIGSTVAQKLVTYGANVTLVDAFLEPYGANTFNISNIEDKVKVNIADIRDKAAVHYLVRNQDIIFNFAGQVAHNDSMQNPYLDADINYIGHLNVLEALKRYNPKAKILYPGSRLQFGQIERNPVDEKHPLKPRSPYALNKTAGENLYLFYHRIYEIPVVIFRIANPYGPRSQMKHSKYSIVNWFIRLALEGKTIKIFGDGDQVRDYIFVEDLADAFILSAIDNNSSGEVLNVGSGIGTTFKEMVSIVLETVGNGEIKHVPWPRDYINIETGDYVTNIKKINKLIKWIPKTDLRNGIEKTVEFYKRNKEKYW